jgi:hypothetical protein
MGALSVFILCKETLLMIIAVGILISKVERLELVRLGPKLNTAPTDATVLPAGKFKETEDRRANPHRTALC